MFKSSFGAFAIALVCAIPSGARAEQIKSSTVQPGLGSFEGGASLLPDVFELPDGTRIYGASETLCQACLWNYAEHYNSAGKPVPQEWVNYAYECCSRCRKSPTELEALQRLFLGVNHAAEMAECLRGMS